MARSRPHEDAERVARRISVDSDRFFGVFARAMVELENFSTVESEVRGGRRRAPYALAWNQYRWT